MIFITRENASLAPLACLINGNAVPKYAIDTVPTVGCSAS